jgi:hypothetical protein
MLNVLSMIIILTDSELETRWLVLELFFEWYSKHILSKDSWSHWSLEIFQNVLPSLRSDAFKLEWQHGDGAPENPVFADLTPCLTPFALNISIHRMTNCHATLGAVLPNPNGLGPQLQNALSLFFYLTSIHVFLNNLSLGSSWLAKDSKIT